jgi:hypothetical protein
MRFEKPMFNWFLSMYMIWDENNWKALQFTLCDFFTAWAKQRGFLTAKAARLDAYRGANHMLRMALDGKICLCFYPPDFTAEKGKHLERI